MTQRPKTYKESFEHVCGEYAEFKVKSMIKIYTLIALVVILLIIIFGLLVFMYS